MMKRFTTTLFIMTLILATAFSSYGQAGNPADLHGSWTLNYTTSLASLDAAGQAKYNGLPEGTRDYLKSTMDGLTITFDANGNYHLSSPEGDEINGSWVWLESGISLEVTHTGGQGKEQHVLGLSAENLVLCVEKQTNTKVVFHNWYLDKQ